VDDAPNAREGVPPKGARARYILVLQWPASSAADFDDLVAMEAQLSSALGPDGSVDGHDFGSGEMNVFVETHAPNAAFAKAAVALGDTPRWSEVRAAYRNTLEDEYEILWPPELSAFSVT
jgi:hypothetical protein